MKSQRTSSRRGHSLGAKPWLLEGPQPRPRVRPTGVPWANQMRINSDRRFGLSNVRYIESFNGSWRSRRHSLLHSCLDSFYLNRLSNMIVLGWNISSFSLPSLWSVSSHGTYIIYHSTRNCRKSSHNMAIITLFAILTVFCTV